MKLKKSLIYSFVASAATLQYTANAVDIVWNGSTSQDINVGSNWNGGIVPPGAGAPADGDAVVNISTGNYPVVTAGESFANRDWKIGMEASNVGRVDHNGGTISTANGSWFFLGTNGGTGTYNLADAAGSGGTYTAMGQGAGSITAGNFYVGIGGYPWDQSNAPARAGNGTLRVNTTGSITTPVDDKPTNVSPVAVRHSLVCHPRAWCIMIPAPLLRRERSVLRKILAATAPITSVVAPSMLQGENFGLVKIPQRV